MKRRRWVWGIVGLALLGGFWAWWTIESSAVRTDFRFLQGPPEGPTTFFNWTSHQQYRLKGDLAALKQEVQAELRERGFHEVVRAEPGTLWKKGPVTVSVFLAQSKAARAETIRLSKTPTPRLILDELTITLSRRHEATPWQKLKSWLGI